MTTRVMIIEDDRDLNNLLRFTLESSIGGEVSSLFRGEQALDTARTFKPDLIILDIMLPDIYGTEILRQFRACPLLARVPVILLTARSREEDKVAGFEAGADDYVTKPFSPRELLLRVQALLRRTQTTSVLNNQELDGLTTASTNLAPPTDANNDLNNNALIQVGPIKISRDKFRVSVAEKNIALTMTEFQLLLHLVERAGRLQSREVLLQKVWGYEGNINTRTVDTHIKRLRQKLGEFGYLIETVHGFGYQLNLPDER